MCDDVFALGPAQHVADFVEAHRVRPLQRRYGRLFAVSERHRAADADVRVRQRHEELDALRGRRQRRYAVRTVLAERRVDLHEQVEERRRNLLQCSASTYKCRSDICCWRIADRQHLRSASCRQLIVPRVRRSTFGARAFAIAGPTVWNSLPDSLRDPAVGPD